MIVEPFAEQYAREHALRVLNRLAKRALALMHKTLRALRMFVLF